MAHPTIVAKRRLMAIRTLDSHAARLAAGLGITGPVKVGKSVDPQNGAVKQLVAVVDFLGHVDVGVQQMKSAHEKSVEDAKAIAAELATVKAELTKTKSALTRATKQNPAVATAPAIEVPGPAVDANAAASDVAAAAQTPGANPATSEASGGGTGERKTAAK